jgi:hypothetical protein
VRCSYSRIRVRDEANSELKGDYASRTREAKLAAHKRRSRFFIRARGPKEQFKRSKAELYELKEALTKAEGELSKVGGRLVQLKKTAKFGRGARRSRRKQKQSLTILKWGGGGGGWGGGGGGVGERRRVLSSQRPGTPRAGATSNPYKYEPDAKKTGGQPVHTGRLRNMG